MRGWLAAAACVWALGLPTAGAWAGQAHPPFAEAVALAKTGQYGAAKAAFETMAQQGHGPAQFNLAVLHARGLGTPQDDQRAYFWAWRARLQNQPQAIALSQRLAMALDAKTQNQVAAELATALEALAAQGEIAALMARGRVALQVQTPPAPTTALPWLNIAAAFGVPKAALLRDAVAAGLSPAQRQTAQTAARALFGEWCGKLAKQAKPPACSTQP